MDESKIVSKLKTTVLEKFKNFIQGNYIKYIRLGKIKTNSTLDGLSLIRFSKLLYNYITKKSSFFKIHML